MGALKAQHYVKEHSLAESIGRVCGGDREQMDYVLASSYGVHTLYFSILDLL